MNLISQVDRTLPPRTFRVGCVSSVQDVVSAVQSSSGHFMLFLAVDATKVGNELLRSVARTLIDRGLAYICVWGPDCSRVHDQFDQERDPDEPNDAVVMTTWHAEEPLEEALWYFKMAACPSDAFIKDCTDWVSISVANSEWERIMQAQLFNEPPDRKQGE